MIHRWEKGTGRVSKRREVEHRSFTRRTASPVVPGSTNCARSGTEKGSRKLQSFELALELARWSRKLNFFSTFATISRILTANNALKIFFFLYITLYSWVILQEIDTLVNLVVIDRIPLQDKLVYSTLRALNSWKI